ETAEVAGIIEQYRVAALNAKKAGFDGVELMAANGHLIDQFLQDNSNKRTDRYGGTIENRARLLFEAVAALVSVWGADRVGVRIAPSGTFNGMADSNPRALFRYVAERLNDFKLAYLHVIEPRIKGGDLIADGQGPVAAQELSKVFHGAIIAAGGFEPRHGGDHSGQRRRQPDRVRPSFHREPGLAEARRVGSSAQSLRPAYVLRLRCARLHRLPQI